MKLKTTLLFLAILWQLPSFSQILLNQQFKWDDKATNLSYGGEELQLWKFDGAITSGIKNGLPVFAKQYAVPAYGRVEVEIVRVAFEDFDMKSSAADQHLREGLVFETTVGRDRNTYYGTIDFVPIVKRNGIYQRVIDIELQLHFTPELDINYRGPENTEISVLNDGDIYKLGVEKRGMHKLTYTFLKNKLNIDVDNIDPRTIKIYGNGGGRVPFYTEADRADDLVENAIKVIGEEDGSFDSGDYILFYAENADKWRFSGEEQRFSREKNIYDNHNYYFLKINAGNGIRVQSLVDMPNATYTSSTFDDFARFEEESVNIFKESGKTEGSGQQWYGDYFKVIRDKDYEDMFLFPNLIASEDVRLKAEMAIRTNVKSKFELTINGQKLTSPQINSIPDLSSGINNFYKVGVLEKTINLSKDDIDININYPLPNTSQTSEAWLDYIELNVRRQLVMSGNQMDFRDITSIGQAVTSFQLSGANNAISIWDITNPLQAASQIADINGSLINFGAITTELKEFIAFDAGAELFEPTFVEKLENQNIHSITEADLVIIYPAIFEVEALRLAEHRRSHNDYNVSIVRIDQLYNEFSSGRQDPAAIRDFARMLYERSENFKYLLLFGDASFDFKNTYGLNNHHIPTFERDSSHPLYNYPMDDFFGVLYYTTSTNVKGNLNLGVGRLPVNSMDKATKIVDKIINYDVNPKGMRDWRTRMVFLADDGDGGRHSNQSNIIANLVRNDHPSFNVDKMYVDAFERISTPAGARSPYITASFNKSMFKGILAAIYLGHGGPKGWAQERILNVSDIKHWSNKDEIPLFITATCSFTGFDNAELVSAGEEVFLNDKGGAIALYTTTRPVYSNENKRLTEDAITHLLAPGNEEIKTLGSVFINAKNEQNSSLNSQKFTLIGDPSQVISLPHYEIKTTKIDGHDVLLGMPDTIRALQKITIEGVVLNENGDVFEAFNGTVYPTIYDKDQDFQTLGQDDNPVQGFKIQKSVLFKGRATVTNGHFSFSCIIPKDIDYVYGKGKISYYAADLSQMIDAAGYSKDIIIGGVTTTGFEDDEGPQVEVLMNTDEFIFGGITNNEPTLLVKLSDDNGINVVGNSIGHDLEGLVDDNTQNTLVLNDFYEAELDDYTKGMVKYPLSQLAEGRHTMRVKAWDVANNSAEGYTEFVVASSAGVALEHVFNYPNPFFDHTCFQFDHNVPGAEMEVSIRIYTVSGKLIKTIRQIVINDGAIRQDDCIEWDGLDEYGDIIGKGVYIYKVYVNVKNTGSNDIKGESAFEKLVILK